MHISKELLVSVISRTLHILLPSVTKGYSVRIYKDAFSHLMSWNLDHVCMHAVVVDFVL